MPGFGERLRREREMRGIGLDEIADATKIGSRSLRALEEENFGQLPGGIFNKGFVRAYARYLGIDEEQAVSDYLAAEASFFAGGGIAPNAPNAAIPEKEAAPARSYFAPVVIVIAIAVVLLGGWRWWARRNSSEAEASSITVKPGSAATRPAAAAAAGTAAPGGATSSVPAPAPADPGDTKPAGAATSGTPNGTTAPKQTATSPTADGATDTRPLATGEFVVLVKARQDSWVSVTADGKDVMNGTLTAAAQRSVHARDRVVLKVGNLPGLEISYNGKALEIPATDNKVRTLTFTATGYRQE